MFYFEYVKGPLMQCIKGPRVVVAAKKHSLSHNCLPLESSIQLVLSRWQFPAAKLFGTSPVTATPFGV